ncbi:MULTISPECIES: hypothetical protein [Aeromonas]|uniref:Uncharacterized protein n=1 Tax=Aeromonas lusitana TaxID=931529 RepID=A0A2M8H962_9GAMM|nr:MULTISPECIES: hypothetical protein [Aeromonas]PJC93106.1 hypothetical protein CUC44_10575 [Aeromonas lusitana]WAF76844.1 hypothetical protein NRL00_20950 [Aeromonas dhakensis]
MKTILAKTFGGLDKAYYFRQLFFGALLPAFIIFMTIQNPTAKPMPVSAMFYLGLNTLLYPYSKFVWDSVTDFLMGNTVITLALPLFLLVKLFTIVICWGLAIFISPIGLAWLWWHHSKTEASSET